MAIKIEKKITGYNVVTEEDKAKAQPLRDAKPTLPAEFAIPYKGLTLTKLGDADGWAVNMIASDGPAALEFLAELTAQSSLNRRVASAPVRAAFHGYSCCSPETRRRNRSRRWRACRQQGPAPQRNRQTRREYGSSMPRQGFLPLTTISRAWPQSPRGFQALVRNSATRLLPTAARSVAAPGASPGRPVPPERRCPAIRPD